MKKSAPKKTAKSVKKVVKKTAKKTVKKTTPIRVSTKPVGSSKTINGFQVFLWLSIIFSSILIIISRL